MKEEVEDKNNRPQYLYNFLKDEEVDLRSIPNAQVSSGSYSIPPQDKQLAIKAIILRKKRQRGYDRILFQTNNSLKTREEEAELKKDRVGFINYVIKKYKKQFPEEILDKSKQSFKQVQKSWNLNDILSYVDQKNSKKAIKKELKKVEKTVKEKKKEKKVEQEEQEKDNFNEDESFGEMNFNKDDDDIGGDDSGGGDEDD